MAGCTRRQKLWRVLLPSAKPSLMIGVNQVIMLALNMVIISSMIGAGGLGYDVLLALRALKIGQAMEAGLAIVIIAIVLDRLSQAIARREPAVAGGGRRLGSGMATSSSPLAVLVADDAARASPSRPLPASRKSLTLTTAPWWKAGVDWITLNLFDTIEAVRVFVLLHFLNPAARRCSRRCPGWACCWSSWRSAGGWAAGGWRCWWRCSASSAAASRACGYPPCRRSISAGLDARRLHDRHSASAFWASRSDRVQSFVLPDHRHAADHSVLLLHHSRSSCCSAWAT